MYVDGQIFFLFFFSTNCLELISKRTSQSEFSDGKLYFQKQAWSPWWHSQCLHLRILVYRSIRVLQKSIYQR